MYVFPLLLTSHFCGCKVRFLPCFQLSEAEEDVQVKFQVSTLTEKLISPIHVWLEIFKYAGFIDKVGDSI